MTTKEKNIKRELDSFFSNKYDQLIEIATIFCRSAEDNPGDLVASTYLTLTQLKNKNGIENSIQKNNLFNFVFVSLRNQVRGSSTSYNRMKIKNRSDISSMLKQPAEYSPSPDELKWLEVTKCLNDLKENETITKYEYRLFQLLNMNEEIIPIHNLSKQEVDKLRKKTLRKLADEVKISHMAIFATCNKVKKLIKQELNIK
jgi:hypothetical protein